eukprot:TRINITY_DN5662_c0_g4_i1.p1 TRINITY_DN5662_c0_g4~~TRINITY_DN5662_c0_g4_i1.p1  ORF type:complete len:866 (+),score=155.76 TRINITY_DN5662_c0_g4_i1:60-2657(+)
MAGAEADKEDESQRIQVAVRCRPLARQERESNVQDICRVMDKRLVILLDPGVAASNDYLRADKSKEKRFAFDHAYGPEVGTQELFEATTQPLIGLALKGFNATVFAYGSTGAGKTFTMIGTPEEPGVMVRTVEGIFAEAREATSGAHEGQSLSMNCSFVEVYNENLRDLGSKDGRDGILDLREDPVTGTSVAGVTEIKAETAQEVMVMLQHGNQRRTTEPTAMNVTSSRSHAVLQVRVERQDPQHPAGTLVGKLSMIDLAGSERASQTNNSGLRLLEGANINRSLLALGNCINALASGSPFVPFRDSKLTRLLKDSLGGNCRTVMVANISPSHLSYEDTLNTLKYANRAKNIRVTAKQNMIKPDDHVAQYQKAIADLRSEVSLLKAKLQRQRTVPPAQLDAADGVAGGGDESELKEASEHWKLEVIRNLETRTSLQRSLIEVEHGLVQWRVELGQAKDVIERWDEQLSPSSPSSRRRHAGPRSLAEWQEHVASIEENMKENVETRRSLTQRLEQNKAAGKELQAQLPQRVVNEDLRAFLELIQRVQVLEVERLELEHFWEIHRRQLESRDQEISMLKEQLKLRNMHINSQRAQLSQERQDQLPGRVSLLGSTLADSSPIQQRGPLRVMQAWAPSARDTGDDELDSRPLRERPPGEAPSMLTDEEHHGFGDRDLPMQDRVINWRALEVPLASQIKGVAQLKQNGNCISRMLAPKGWKAPELRSIPETDVARVSIAGTGLPPPAVHVPAAPRLATGGPGASSQLAGQRSPQRRGNTCPPMRRKFSLEAPPQLAGARQPSVGDVRNPQPVRGLLRAHGVAPAGSRDQRQVDKHAGGPYREPSSRIRSRSEHSSRMVRAGRIAVQTPGR